MKAKVIVQFRGADYSQLYEKGETYDFEQKRAEALAARGLVEITKEQKEVPAEASKAKPETQVVEPESAEVPEAKVEETPRRGRKKAAE